MTIAYDNASSIGETTGDGNWSHAGAASNVKGALVYVVVQGDNTAPLGVTYGSTSMTKIATANDTATEKGNTTAWFLGTSVPQGTQTVAVDVGAAQDWNAVCITYTGATDTTYFYGTLGENATLSNATEGTTYPSINQPLAVQSDWVNIPSAAVFSGNAALTDVAAGTGFTTFGGIDHGQMVSQFQRYTTGTATGKPTTYFTAASDDVAMVSVLVGEKRSASITTTTISRTAGMTAPTVTASAARTPTTIAQAVTIPAPTKTASAAKELTTIARAVEVPTPTVTALSQQDASPVPDTVARSVAVGGGVVTAGAARTPDAVALQVSIPTPTVTASAASTPDTVSMAASMTAPPTAAGASVTPATIALAVSMGDAPTVEASAARTPEAIALVAAMDAPTSTAEARAPPDTVAAQAAVWDPTIAASASLEAGNVGAVVVVPTPVVVGGGAPTAIVFYDAPQNLSGEAVSGTQVDLTWDAVSGADTYAVIRDGVVIATGVATNAYSDEDCDPNTTYHYRVRVEAMV